FFSFHLGLGRVRLWVGRGGLVWFGFYLLPSLRFLLIGPGILLGTERNTAKDDIDLDALAAEIEGAGAAKEQEPQKAKGKKKKEKKRQDFDEDDILKELEELSWEAQGIKGDREPAAVKPTENNEDEPISKQDKKKKGQKGKKQSFEDN
uniref:Eukaryotic translation initiation factor 5B n=1 Tax=Capra hircus TaxID=9925 RepID=A0A8C2P5R1_CAPHI